MHEEQSVQSEAVFAQEGLGGEGPGVGDEAQDRNELSENPPEQLDQTLFEQNGG